MNTLNQLKEHGYRLTKPRQELLKVLVNYPLTVKEIFDKIKKKHIHINLTSVYRSLELFVDMGIVRVIEFGDDKKRYEIVSINNHHHHLICTNCRAIEDIIIDENNFLEKIKIKSKFKINHHNLEFFGLCSNCQ